MGPPVDLLKAVVLLHRRIAWSGETWKCRRGRPSRDPRRHPPKCTRCRRSSSLWPQAPRDRTTLEEFPPALTNPHKCRPDRTALQELPPVGAKRREFARGSTTLEQSPPVQASLQACGRASGSTVVRRPSKDRGTPCSESAGRAAPTPSEMDCRTGGMASPKPQFGRKTGRFPPSAGGRGFDPQHAPARKTANAPTLQLRSQSQQTRAIRAGNVRRIGFLGRHVGIPARVRARQGKWNRIGFKSRQCTYADWQKRSPGNCEPGPSLLQILDYLHGRQIAN